MRILLMSVWIICCCYLRAEESVAVPKFIGSVDVSVFPVHRASLLGLTSTEYPTLGLGFKGSYGNWSFYSITFQELDHSVVLLSQSESNLNYKIVENEKLKLSLFNTFITTVKNSALYMIPTVSIGVGQSKQLSFDLTPYTWGFNTHVSGFTYSAVYNVFKKLNPNLNCGFVSKFLYTDIQPSYAGTIAELSPFLKWKSYSVQSRFIYQFAHTNFVYDVSMKKIINL